MPPNIDKEQAEKYAQSVMKRLDNDPDSLDKHEKRLAVKYKEAVQNMQKVAQDINDMKTQIAQGQARLRSMELQFEQEQGRCNGFVEYLVDLKFVEEEPSVEPVPDAAEGAAAGASNGNGSKPVNRKQKRTAKAKGRARKPGVKTTNGKSAPAA